VNTATSANVVHFARLQEKGNGDAGLTS